MEQSPEKGQQPVQLAVDDLLLRRRDVAPGDGDFERRARFAATATGSGRRYRKPKPSPATDSDTELRKAVAVLSTDWGSFWTNLRLPFPATYLLRHSTTTHEGPSHIKLLGNETRAARESRPFHTALAWISTDRNFSKS